MMKIKAFIKDIFDKIKWFFTGKYYVFAVLIVVITFLYIIKVIPFGQKIVSTVFSIGGVIIILCLQLTDARKYANYRPFTPAEWVRSFPRKKPGIVGHMAATLSGIALSASAIVGPSPDWPIEQKVDYLVKQVLAIQSSLGALDQNLRNEQESRKKDSGKIRSEIDGLNKSINAIIANHIIGDFDKNILGIVATVCGVIIQLFY